MNCRLPDWIPFQTRLLLPEPQIDWCWLGSRRFIEPFFEQTVSRALELPFNRLFVHSAPITELGGLEGMNAALSPTGFIFHMSRCGSTLISRMFAALPDTVVLSEAAPIDRLARASWLPEPDRLNWFRGLIGALGQPRTGAETRLIIKFDSITVTQLTFIRRAYPDVPWVFVYRDPQEVLASHLLDPAPAMNPGIITDAWILDTPVIEAVALPPEDFAARVLGVLCETASRSADSSGLLVNYNELPDAVTTRIARHFKMNLREEDMDLIRQVIPFHAKSHAQRFSDDRSAKHGQLDDAARQAVSRWISPHYARLEELRKSAAPAHSIRS